MQRSKQKRAVAITSIWSYIDLINSGQPIQENKRVLVTLHRNPPLTSRKISRLTGIERTNITRVLYDLQKLNLVEVDKFDQCNITGKKVKYYRLKGTSKGLKDYSAKTTHKTKERL